MEFAGQYTICGIYYNWKKNILPYPFKPWLRTLKSNCLNVMHTLISTANCSPLPPDPGCHGKYMQTRSSRFMTILNMVMRHFTEFQPSAVGLHYCDPVNYAEILRIEGDMERAKLKEELQNCLRFSCIKPVS